MDENKELIFSQEYDMSGQKLNFRLYRQEKEDRDVEMDLTYQFEVPGADEIVCKRIRFPKEAEAYESPLLSWYNLICCSNNYGPIPVVSYMNYAVQNQKKVAATIYPETYLEYTKIIQEAGDDYYCFPYHPREYEYMLYISRKGTLSDYFDLEQILEVYQRSGIVLDPGKMQDYFSRELSWFGNEEECPIEIHNCLGTEELVVVGLLFGYPVGSTVALINRSIDLCS